MKTYKGKRIFDVSFAGLAVLLLLPVYLLVGLSVWLFDGHPIFFTQWRLAAGKASFKIYKFRTMIGGAESSLPEIINKYKLVKGMFHLPNDPRVTKLGRLLRRFNLDELPQLINIIKGEMSIVGPRPYPLSIDAVIRRRLSPLLQVKPGLTGQYQLYCKQQNLVQGKIEDLLRQEGFYIDNISFINDLKIIIKTLPVILVKQKF